MKYKFGLNPRIVLPVSVVIVTVMLISAIFRLRENRNEIYRLSEYKSKSLLETIYAASINTLHSGEEIEDLLAERLLNNARMIRHLDSAGTINSYLLHTIAIKNHLFRINVFNSKGDRMYSNAPYSDPHPEATMQVNRKEKLLPILNGETDELVIGLKDAMHKNEKRFAVAVARSGGKGVIVINLDAKDLLQFRKEIGIGKLIKDFAKNPEIKYIALQDESGIILANENNLSLNKINDDEFLRSALASGSLMSRTFNYGEDEVFEVVRRFEYNGEKIGVFRLALSLEMVKNLNKTVIFRIILFTSLLGIIGIIVLSIIITSGNVKNISREYEKFKSFTSSILTNLGEVVLVLDPQLKIVLVNRLAEELMNASQKELSGRKLEETPLSVLEEHIKSGINYGFSSEDIEVVLQKENIKSIFLANIRERFIEHEKEKYFILVLKDITKQKELEEFNSRNQKLSAMADLAAGVAHEVRNPINAIGMISQRLKLEFEAKKDEGEYKNILDIQQNEIQRINKIITQFLTFSKPVEILRKENDINVFLANIFKLMHPVAESVGVKLVFNPGGTFVFNFDADLMQQTIINIIKNGIEACNNSGKVELSFGRSGSTAVITVEDNGIGISEEVRKKLFNLYFTTKNEGNGLGLSISQKIIQQHNGNIEIQSELNKGTKVIINLPLI